MTFLPGGVTCLECGYLMDATTGLNDAYYPNKGDVSICVRCGALALFDPTPFGMALRPVPPEQRDAVEALPVVRQVRSAIVSLRARRGLNTPGMTP
jgi:hypothetical protein